MNDNFYLPLPRSALHAVGEFLRFILVLFQTQYAPKNGDENTALNIINHWLHLIEEETHNEKFTTNNSTQS